MKEIIVISGKGGCGKTSVTAGLAYLAGSDIVIGDADVDAADMHLLLAPENTEHTAFYSGKLAVVNQDECTLCEECIKYCQFKAIDIRKSTLSINSLNCEGCGLCMHICPASAIEMQTQRAGFLKISTARTNAPMVHAQLDTAADNSGKLVTEVKKKSREIAESTGKELILTDGPPGIGCPVIAALSGASLALIVTEPTLSGWHDMERINGLIQKMNVPAAILINKAGLNKEIETIIHRFAEKNGILDLGELPYDPIFSKAVSKGLTIPEAGREDLKNRFHEIWETLLKQ